jgi:hypothetical protein
VRRPVACAAVSFFHARRSLFFRYQAAFLQEKSSSKEKKRKRKKEKKETPYKQETHR